MRMPMSGIIAVALLGTTGVAGAAQEQPAPAYLADRGGGVPASVFGTYIRQGQLLVYPFFAYTRDNNREYDPEEWGFGPPVDFRGKYWASEALIFLGYGLTDWLAIELEAAYIDASFEKSPLDTTATPARIEESGVTDIEAQIRARFMREGNSRPELFGFLEVTAPSHRGKVLIGDNDWNFKPGIGLVRGFSWGTVTLRTAVEYTKPESKFDLGEVALEYLKRLSPAWRLYLAVEGGEGASLDEWEFISGVRWHLRKHVSLKVDNAVGITSKATDWAPQVGIMLSFPP